MASRAFDPASERNRAAFLASFAQNARTAAREDGSTTLEGILTPMTDWTGPGETPGLAQASRAFAFAVRSEEGALDRYERLTIGGTAYSVQSSGVPDGYGFTVYQLDLA